VSPQRGGLQLLEVDTYIEFTWAFVLLNVPGMGRGC
jgi:hypothetical protein